MRKLLKSIVICLVAAVAVVVGGAYVLPGEAYLSRNTVIAAPPEKVFAVTGDLKRFNEWSPWADIDPSSRYSFAGPATGIGQSMSWTSQHPDVGNGRQTIVEYVANAHTAAELDFGAMGKAIATIDLEPVAGGTSVTWGFRARLDGVMERWLGLLFDRWVGADYEKGLAKLRRLIETPAEAG